MKKSRFLSLLLAALMVASTVLFSGCSESEEEGGSTANTSTKEIVALNMYILTEESTTKEAADRVQMAINEILLPNYKTMLKINYLTEEEYWGEVEKMLEATDPTVNTSTTSAKVIGTEKLDFAQTIEYIFKEDTKTLELDAPQIDILIVNDYDKYVELANDGKLAGLNEFISYDSKILKTNVHPTLMSAAQVGTQIYGIPTNIGVDAGEYTYLIFNKDLVEKYGYNYKDLANFGGNFLTKFSADIKANEPGIWPLSAPFGIAGEELYEDVFAVAPTSIQYIGSSLEPKYLHAQYRKSKSMVDYYSELGYFPAGNAPENANYAVRVETSKELLTADEDKMWTAADGTNYVRYLFDVPRISVDEAFTSVMSVSGTSPVPDRAMEIITLFQTNSELANLLQYGIEGVNYQIDERDGSLVKMDDTYSMDNIVTGNTFIKYPENNDKDYLKKCVAMNLGTAPSALFGFDLDLNGADKSKYETIKNIMLAADRAVENGAKYDDVQKIVNRELVLLGCGLSSTSYGAYDGIAGDVQKAQSSLVSSISAGFRLSNEIMNYNAHCGAALEKPVEETTATGEAVAVDLDGDGVVDGYDTNGDGAIDAYDTNEDGVADAFDTDGDGQIDAYDADGDGEIDGAEGEETEGAEGDEANTDEAATDEAA